MAFKTSRAVDFQVRVLDIDRLPGAENEPRLLAGLGLILEQQLFKMEFGPLLGGSVAILKSDRDQSAALNKPPGAVIYRALELQDEPPGLLLVSLGRDDPISLINGDVDRSVPEIQILQFINSCAILKVIPGQLGAKSEVSPAQLDVPEIKV